MKNTILIFFVCLLFIRCQTNSLKNESTSRNFNVKDLFRLIKTEKKYLYESKLDSTYSIDSSFISLTKYREKLISILDKEKFSDFFDRGLLIEDFFIYKKGIRKSITKDYPYDYRAVIYFETLKTKLFLDISISRDCQKFVVDKIRVNKDKETDFQ